MADLLRAAAFDAFIKFIMKKESISVPTEFHERCKKIDKMLSNDCSGIINTILDYSVNSASEAAYSVECNDESVEELLNEWLDNINVYIDGVPSGLQDLAREYFKERWQGSSFCVLRVSGWKKFEVGQNSIKVPTVLWFINGSSVYVKRVNETNYKLGTDRYFLDEGMKIELKNTEKEKIIIQKPFDRWFADYATPFCIRKGIYKNYRAIEVLQEKSDEVITKILPYLLLITKGDKDLFLQKDVKYDDDDMKELVTRLKPIVDQTVSSSSNTTTFAQPFDQKLEHFIPDLRTILAEELYRQGYRALLSGLGFVDVIQGISDTRKESVLNPKPFITEVNSGVSGFKTMLLDVIKLIIQENKLEHKKLFSEKNKLHITNSPLKINVEAILDQIRSSFVYGVSSIRTYQEILGLDPETELERMKKERENGLRDLFYPHLTQNREDIPDSGKPSITKKQNEKQQEKEKQPEHMQEAISQNDLEISPYTMKDYPEYLNKYPKHAIEIWVTTFNEVLKKTGDEAKAFPIAWNALKRYMKKLKENK